MSLKVPDKRSRGSQINSATVDIQVTVVEGREFRNSHIIRPKPSYFVELQLDHGASQIYRTAVGRRTDRRQNMTWGEKFVFPANLSTLLQLRVYCTHGRKTDQDADHVIGEATVELLEIRRNETSEIELLNPAKAPASRAVSGCLTLLVKVDVSVNFVSVHASSAKTSPTPLHHLRQREIIESLSSEELNKMTPSWTRLFNSLGNISLLAEKVAELDTRAKVAVGALIFAVKIVIQQINRDDRVEALVRIMNDLYIFFLDADPMKKILSFKMILQRLLAQTTECAYFIAEYRKIKLFAQRTVVNIVSNADALIAQFETTFGELKIEIILGSSLQTAVVSFRILETVRNIENFMYIECLARLKNVDEDSSRNCIRGTFENIINEIIGWASIPDDDSSDIKRNLYLLFGPPNYGKSFIAHTVTTLFRLHGRVGVAIFLSDRTDGRIDSHTLSSTIAFQLAHYHQDIKERMAAKIQADFSIASADIGRQFRDLVVSSLENIIIPGPVLIVVDGLHQIPKKDDRHRFLTSVIHTLPHFPSNFRFLVTARPEDLHDDKIYENPHCRTRDIGIDSNGLRIPTIDEQIRVSMRQLLKSKPKLLEKFDFDSLCRELEKRALGIQLWVSTIFSSIISSGDAEAYCILNSILSNRMPLLKEETMGHLYSALLYNLQPRDLSIYEVFNALRKSPVPLSLESLSEKYIINTWRNRGILVPKDCDLWGAPLFSLHPGFEDYLASPALYGGVPHSLSLSGQAQYQAGICLEHMNQSLRYNMCKLDDPMLLNIEILDEEDRIHKYIPQALRNSCCNWGFYLGAANNDKESAPVGDLFWKELDSFMYVHLLHWIEAMSMMGSFRLVMPSLERLAAWLKNHGRSSQERYLMIVDCIYFVRGFSGIISEAAMQTYISALPLVPSDSLILNHYGASNRSWPQDGGISNLTSNGTLQWEALTKPFPRVGAISCAAISEYHIAFGFPSGGGLSIWDIKTGQKVGTTILSNSTHSTIVSMAFSPDGKHITTGAEKEPVVVSDVKTGQTYLSFPVHLDQMFFTPLVFYSADSSTIMIVDNSEVNKNIWIRDAISGYHVRDFQVEIYGEASHGLALSPNGLELAVTRQTGIEVITVCTGETISIGRPFAKYGKDLSACGLAWSPDGNFIAIKCTSDILCIWSTRDGSVQLLHPQGRYHIEDLVFSPDSSRLLASTQPFDGQKRGTGLHIWDVYTGGLIGKQEVDQDPWNIKLIAFLPGSRTIAVSSGSSECRMSYFTDTSPAYLSDSRAPSFHESKPIPTICYSRITSVATDGFSTTIDNGGWIRNTSGQRLLWVPYPGYRLWQSMHTQSKVGQNTFTEKDTILEVREPKTNTVVLRYIIEFKAEDEPKTSGMLLSGMEDEERKSKLIAYTR